ncbi:hypothetical protein J2W14_004048 [Pseudarthrobacter oxydans]|uniref:hypothetical protein n=1 Tax=Pseudarthrobacter oxydans TaxID=1671 RepID=UPI002782ED8B|nr:hypothetical protein [Pseudarthrobacter oxydans]MDP9984621.1 hypothetical protein [Pseudarthrobacter oxydans]
MDLTKDGYLKPAMVQRATDELGWSDPIMGKGNREINARPVLVLRQHLMDWKLLRRSGGKLVLTPQGLQRPGDLRDYMVEEIARPKHDAVKLTTRLYAEWHRHRVRHQVRPPGQYKLAGARWCEPVHSSPRSLKGAA